MIENPPARTDPGQAVSIRHSAIYQETAVETNGMKHKGHGATRVERIGQVSFVEDAGPHAAKVERRDTQRPATILYSPDRADRADERPKTAAAKQSRP
jgi:hypothetical protein